MKYVKVLKDSNTGTILYKSDKHFMVSNSTFHESKMFSDKKEALKHFRLTINNTWKQWKEWKAQKDVKDSQPSIPNHKLTYTLESRTDNEELARFIALDKKAYANDVNYEFTLQPEDRCNVNKFDAMLKQRIHYGDQGHFGCIKRGYKSPESKAHFITELDKLIEKGEYK
jgi:hypothetical protein